MKAYESSYANVITPRELDGLSRSAHLFCEDAKVNGTIIDCLQLFAYDGPDVAQYQKEITTRIDQQLGKCDRCIIAYYKAKGKMIEELRKSVLMPLRTS